MAGRRFTRPRTRMYDCNYTMGENYYRPALDSLDRKYGGGGLKETLEAPRRPLSMGNLEQMMDGRPEAAMEAINSQIEDDLESMTRMRRARARQQPSPEQNFEAAFLNRREEVKRRFSEKMLDSVGINGSALEEEANATTASLRRRALRMVTETEEEAPSKVHKWTAVRDPLEETMEDLAAKNRARISRARIADLENEMEEMAERGAARERRLAGLRQLLGESNEQQQQQVRLKKTVTITEKRVV